MAHDIVILGVFVADTSYRAARPPRMGETILGKSFALGPGGKGSNQAVAAARAGGDVAIYTKLGCDPFADMAFSVWNDAGVTSLATQHPESYTGAAYIFIEDGTGNNAIIICPGVGATLSPDDIEKQRKVIESAKVFVAQLEQPTDAAQRALELARAAGVTTVLNPAPAAELEDRMLTLCDYITPNETEAGELTGISVDSVDDARQAADILLDRGVGKVIVTLGENGALYHDKSMSLHTPAASAGAVVETTGAGDAFNGALAVALSERFAPDEALRFANAAAAISVTRPGTAPSMPSRSEIENLLKNTK